MPGQQRNGHSSAKENARNAHQRHLPEKSLRKMASDRACVGSRSNNGQKSHNERDYSR